MDWKTFIHSILDAIIWPSALLFLFMYFRKPITSLISRAKSIKHKDTSVVFGEALAERASTADFHDGDATPSTYTEPFDLDKYMEGLNSVSQKSALTQASVLLESEIERLYHDEFKESPHILFSKTLDILKEKDIINDDAIDMIHGLITLRHAVLHDDSFELSSNSLKEILHMTKLMLSSLRDKKKLHVTLSHAA